MHAPAVITECACVSFTFLLQVRVILRGTIQTMFQKLFADPGGASLAALQVVDFERQLAMVNPDANVIYCSVRSSACQDSVLSWRLTSECLIQQNWPNK